MRAAFTVGNIPAGSPSAEGLKRRCAVLNEYLDALGLSAVKV